MAAALVVCVAIPTAVVATTAPGDDERPAPAGEVDGLRVESWHNVSIEVPDTWGYGRPDAWCAGDGEVTDYRVGRPGTTESIACTPSSSYGVSFTATNDEGPKWPVAPQHSDAWPDGAYVGATTLGHVVVTVAAEDAMVAQAVLSSAHEINGVDANGCPSYGGDAVTLADDAMTICRYDGIRQLEQSERLSGDDLEAAQAALAAAPPGDYSYCGKVHTSTVVMVAASWSASVDLDCGRLDLINGRRGFRMLTPDVLYWALSPGWSGDGTGLPLPKELRRQ
jgi:hypothetical protein